MVPNGKTRRQWEAASGRKMANISEITLNEFFSSGKGRQWDRKLSAIESNDRLSVLKARMLKEGKMRWPVAFEHVVDQLPEMLDIRVRDILAGAWNKQKALLKYLDRNQYPPGQTVQVPLARHVVNSEHRPSINILVNGAPIGRVEFKVTVTLLLEGIVLSIRDGRIMRATTGSCRAKGEVKCANQIIMEKKPCALDLPRSIDLGAGVPITG